MLFYCSSLCEPYWQQQVYMGGKAAAIVITFLMFIRNAYSNHAMSRIE